MSRLTFAIAVAAITLCMAPSALSAATANRTWVSHNGLSSNTTASPPCNPQAPCDTFVNALSVTAAGGEINCLDNGSYGPVSITQSVTIDCGGRLGGIDVSGSANAITVNGSNISVTLRKLTINGNGGSGTGVAIQNAAAVTVEHCVIENFSGNNGNGISDVSSSSLQLDVSDTRVSNSFFGILVNPAGGSGSVTFVLDRVVVENGFNGITANGNTSTGVIRGFVRESVVTGSTNNGVVAANDPGAALTVVSVYDSHVVKNVTGVFSGNAAALILSHSTIQANGTALISLNGGSIFSYGNNDINDNGTFGSAPTVIPDH